MISTLSIGAVIIVAVLLLYEEVDKVKASRSAASAAQTEADASIYAVEGQDNEITNIPAGGVLPANTLTEAPNEAINEFVGEAN